MTFAPGQESVQTRADVIPLVCASLDRDEIDAAVAVLQSGQFRQGPVCAEFERSFASASGAACACTTANGTTALQLAYESLIKPGDEVLCNAFGFIATASMLVARGAVPIFCDADPRTFNIDPADAAQRITPKTTAIVATHLYGNPADVVALEVLAGRHNLKLIYDAAQAHLATFNGQGMGVFGDAVTYSFYPTKNMTTGEGGMITTNDEQLAFAIACQRDHGLKPGQRYCHVDLGYNYRLTDIAAAIGLKQLEKLPTRTAARRANAARLNTLLADVEQIITPEPTPRAQSSWHQYTIRLVLDRLSIGRDEFAQRLLDDGVPSAVHYPRSIPDQPIMLERAVRRGPTPVSDQLAREVLCLPIHHALTSEQIERLAAAVRCVAQAASR